MSDTRSQLFGRRGGGAHRDAQFQQRQFDEYTDQSLESQNDSLHDILGEKVAQLKNVSLAIRDETVSQNKTLDEMDNTFDKTLQSLSGTMKSLTAMMESGGSKHMCYLALFIFAFFMLLYLMLR